MYNDNIYCNEKKIDEKSDKWIEQIIDEVKVSKSKGAGITGGDPLCALQKTCDIIKALKTEFGTEFHIHLYTSLNLISEKYVTQLAEAGLNELRVHPDLYDKKLWNKISIPTKICKSQNVRYGIEIPCIPEREAAIGELIDFAKSKNLVEYVDLNELEASCTNAKEFINRGLEVKQLSSYAVVGSEACGLRLVKKFATKIFPIHYCTCKLKDAVQLSNRLKRRAKSIKQPHQLITKEGTLFFGEVHLPKEDNAKAIMTKIAKEFKIPERLYSINNETNVITIAAWVLMELVDEFPGKKIVVTQYPTADKMRVQEEEIGKLDEASSERIIG